MIGTTTYLKGVWSARYFWLHLALADVRAKYRRSALGLAWALIQPLALTLLLTFVMGHIFHSQLGEYAPFIYSGLIFWEFIVSSIVSGCNSFVNAEGYIKQFAHPLLIYTLRCVIPCMINLGCAFIGMILWVLFWKPSNFGLSWLVLIPAFPLLFLFTWPLATITAFIGTRFRDFSQLIVIMLQAVYYVSPIFFLPTLFINAKIGFLLEYNPIYHLLNLFRIPLLQGQYPAMGDYLYVIMTSAILWFFAWWMIDRNEHKVIFYI